MVVGVEAPKEGGGGRGWEGRVRISGGDAWLHTMGVSVCVWEAAPWTGFRYTVLGPCKGF